MSLIKTKEEIEIIKEGGKILSFIIKKLKEELLPGVNGEYLNDLAEDLIKKYKGKPSFKGYNGFPSSLCLSINEEIVHGIPFNKIIKDKDIVSLDLGIFYNGFHNDMAITVPVGNVDSEILRLIRTTKKALKRGIKKVRPGNTIGDIGNTIQRFIEGQNFGVVRDLCGHGIGRDVHEEPDVLNFGKRHKGLKLEEGMVICIEPMATMGSFEIKKGKDGFSYETKDKSLSAHFEHTIIITREGGYISTEL